MENNSNNFKSEKQIAVCIDPASELNSHNSNEVHNYKELSRKYAYKKGKNGRFFY